MPIQISDEKISRMREFASSGMLKKEIAIEIGVNILTVLKYTKGIQSQPYKRRKIEGEGFVVLQRLIENGWYIKEDSKEQYHWYRKLKMSFRIRKVRFNRRVIYFLPGKEAEAMEAFLKRYGNHVHSTTSIGNFQRLFGVR